MEVYTKIGQASIITLLISFLSTYLLYYFLNKSKLNSIPCYGGVAVFLGFWSGFYYLFASLLTTRAYFFLFIASLIVLITGILDDKYCLKPWQKSLGILIAANIIYFFTDIEFSSIFLPNIQPILFRIVSYLLTIIWIYFVTNAVNLLDGIDGLAGSVTVVSLLAMLLTTLLFSLSVRVVFIAMLLLLMIAIIGFLPFNWYPAKIYLGDTGALFIGFMFAVLGVSNLKNASFFTMILPIFIYVVPLFDTSYAIFRRLITGNSIVHRDQEHVHHRLKRLGYSSPKVVFLMIGITLLFSCLGMAIQYFREYRLWLFILTGIIVMCLSYWMYNLGKKSK